MQWDWSSLCPSTQDIEEQFSGREIHGICHNPNYPRVEVEVDNEVWAWDRWHGGGFWHKIPRESATTTLRRKEVRR